MRRGPEGSRGGRRWFRWLLGTGAALGLTGPPAQDASPGELAEVEQWVRAPRYEGLGSLADTSLSPEAVTHLAGLLRDPREQPHHARILEVLGRQRVPAAADAVLGYLAQEPEGAVSSAIYRARLAARYAAGRLARHDPRALAYVLIHAVPDAPRWSCGGLRADGLRRLLGETALAALALSGRPEAEARLHGLLAAEPPPGETRSAWRERVGEALRLHHRRAPRGGGP